MAQIIMNIPDQYIARILDAFAVVYGYDAADGLTKAQFAKSKVRDYIKEIVVRHEGSLARQAANDTVQDEIDAIDIT